MLPYFPRPYPDELFFSRCARYAEWVGYPTMKAVFLDLFGQAYQTLAIDFPRHLDAFIAALPSVYNETVDHLIEQATLLPFYAPFLPAPRVHALRQLIQGQNSRVTSPGLLGWLQNRSFRSPYLRLCLACVEEEKTRYGEPYWHRVHQLPGVFWCPNHEQPLHRSQVTYWDRLISAEQAQNDPLVPAEHVQTHERGYLIQFAKDAAWLLQVGNLPCDPDGVQSRYVWLVADRRLGSYTGRIREEKLITALSQFYPATIFERFGCQGLRAQGSSPFLKLVRPFRHAQHPVYHLLFMQFLGVAPSTFWTLPARPAPFGTGPWPCLNPAARHHHQWVVQTCQIRSSAADGRPLGTFHCRCGFIYQRVGPDLGPLSRYITTRIVKQAKSQEILPLAKPDGITRSRLDAARRAWLTVLEQSVDPRQPAAKQQAPQLYSWLHLHDRSWLHLHRPTYRARIARRSCADWKSRDEILYQAIAQAAELLLGRPGRPLQITAGRLLREARFLAQIPVQRAKMPRAIQRLKELSEDEHTLVYRRLRWACQQYRAEQRFPTRSEFVSRMGLGSRIYNAPEIKMMVHRAFAALCDAPSLKMCDERQPDSIANRYAAKLNGRR